MPDRHGTRNAGAPATSQPEAFVLDANGWIPNNERLPVLLYRGAIALDGAADVAVPFEQRFTRNGWPSQWRDGVYDFHHFHPATHEVLGFARGWARLVLGGPPPLGRELEVRAGDVVVLPAGTGHRRIEASDDFLVVGGYPPNQDTGISRTAVGEEQRQAMLRTSFPPSDPVAGPGGPLTRLWAHPQ
ncbi:cupin [Trinickia caryophylli]|nr:cupin [Trinickia caryophylli]TRX15299.1 cupin [Trinickia caryophylli]